MGVELTDQQLEAIDKMKNGSILAADVGTGKTRTALAYYYLRVCGGQLCINGHGSFKLPERIVDLYIITTAKKRDDLEWELELAKLSLSKERLNKEKVNVTVDSWNNIQKYKKVYGGFFIFDEQRLTGHGPWVKSFLSIANRNKWILLSATPGDKWADYIPVFIANGFYTSKTAFERRHFIYSKYYKYPKVTGYMYEGELLKHQQDILVRMELPKTTVPHHTNVTCSYDKALYKRVWKDRWDPFKNAPIEEVAKLFYLLRLVVNMDISREEELKKIAIEHKRIIVFYNFVEERNKLTRLFESIGFNVGEWNGQAHTPIPDEDPWAYLVQYAGAEGWNCIITDTLVFYSQTYSYKAMVQAAGRIDRMNTKYKDLYYYHFRSPAPIDLEIERALKKKQEFNLNSFKRYLRKHSK